ncbi:hypothetical protein EIK56_23045 [Sphingomonas sp. C8-2]|nr:hypothetical protein EIK56_23045 [Sphingomonas sp. C8-2]
MGWFDPPAIAIRKILPEGLHVLLNPVEEFAQDLLRDEAPQHKPYQLGIVLALWVKAAVLTGEFGLPARSNAKVQRIYESSIKVLGRNASTAFLVTAHLAEQDGMYGTPAGFYYQLAENMASWA